MQAQNTECSVLILDVTRVNNSPTGEPVLRQQNHLKRPGGEVHNLTSNVFSAERAARRLGLLKRGTVMLLWHLYKKLKSCLHVNGNPKLLPETNAPLKIFSVICCYSEDENRRKLGNIRLFFQVLQSILKNRQTIMVCPSS